jgi:protein TonB
VRDQGLEGVVEIQAIIGRDGTVLAPRVVNADIHPAFASAALEAVKQWRYSPTLLNGQPVEISTTISVRFSMTD